MKPSFHHKLVNGPYEDPCLYVRLFREHRALLFDCGDMPGMSLSEIQKISDIFVTHMHIDHFIGLDRVLRTQLSREHTLTIHGPEDIIACVEGKLRGYAWNLIEQYPLKLEVRAVHEGRIRRAAFAATERFVRQDLPDLPFDGTLLRESAFKVMALPLTHDIPSLGFKLEEDFHINIDKSALEALGLPVGPWLGQLKEALWDEAPADTGFSVDGRRMSLEELKKIVIITKGQKLSYIADTAPTEDNISRITEFVRGSSALYCEAYFLDAERDRAMERNHLTGKIAGMIAKEAGVHAFYPFHYSAKYKRDQDTPEQEALAEFGRP